MPATAHKSTNFFTIAIQPSSLSFHPSLGPQICMCMCLVSVLSISLILVFNKILLVAHSASPPKRSTSSLSVPPEAALDTTTGVSRSTVRPYLYTQRIYITNTLRTVWCSINVAVSLPCTHDSQVGEAGSRFAAYAIQTCGRAVLLR